MVILGPVCQLFFIPILEVVSFFLSYLLSLKHLFFFFFLALLFIRASTNYLLPTSSFSFFTPLSPPPSSYILCPSFEFVVVRWGSLTNPVLLSFLVCLFLLFFFFPYPSILFSLALPSETVSFRPHPTGEDFTRCVVPKLVRPWRRGKCVSVCLSFLHFFRFLSFLFFFFSCVWEAYSSLSNIFLTEFISLVSCVVLFSLLPLVGKGGDILYRRITLISRLKCWTSWPVLSSHCVISQCVCYFLKHRTQGVYWQPSTICTVWQWVKKKKEKEKKTCLFIQKYWRAKRV